MEETAPQLQITIVNADETRTLLAFASERVKVRVDKTRKMITIFGGTDTTTVDYSDSEILQTPWSFLSGVVFGAALVGVYLFVGKK
jgi:hypothetical protein